MRFGGMRMASPRNSSAMLAASMAIGSGSRGDLAATGVGRHARGGAVMGGEATSVDLDAAGESEADRLRKKRQAIFKSKFEVDEKIVSRNKALIALVKVERHPALHLHCEPPWRESLPRPDWRMCLRHQPSQIS